MKKVKITHILFSLLLGASAAVLGSYPALKNIKIARSENRADILHLNQMLNQALLSRDFKTLDRLIADDFEIYMTSGSVLDKKTWISQIQKGELNFSKLEYLSNGIQGNKFQGNEFQGLMKVEGEFSGKEKSTTVQMTIRSISKTQGRQIKCIVVKAV